MRVILAPMEGVVNHILRDLLSRDGSLDRCVTEFVRVTDQRLPAKVFYRLCPELLHGGTTPSGTPVYVQLLGSRPDTMASNAARAAHLGAHGIDLNFGCPAKTVNRSNGGSILLKDPERVAALVEAVRDATPSDIPVTAKIRLGYEHSHDFETICQLIMEAGANELVVHARTKADGYKPPAYWQHLSAVAKDSPIPIIANGEIWTVADYHQCRAQSLCPDVMLGRGMLSCPNLAAQIKAGENGEHITPMAWLEAVTLLQQQLQLTIASYPAKYAGNPIKQWLGYLRKHYLQAQRLLEAIKRIKDPYEIATILADYQTQIRETLAA